MLLKIVIGIAIGAAVGGAIGSTRSCETGGCPLTANPKRGALYGGFMGLLFTIVLTSPGGLLSTAPPPSPFVPAVESAKAFQQDIVNVEGKAVAYFTADWCPTCKRFSPILYEVAEAESPDVPFRKVDVDDHPGLAKMYDVYALPTTIVFENGNAVKRFEGIASKETLIESLS